MAVSACTIKGLGGGSGLFLEITFNTSAVIRKQFIQQTLYLSAQVVLHLVQPPKLFVFTCMYSTPGRFTIMNT